METGIATRAAEDVLAFADKPVNAHKLLWHGFTVEPGKRADVIVCTADNRDGATVRSAGLRHWLDMALTEAAETIRRVNGLTM